MADYKTIEEVRLEGQRTFMRVDFNVLEKDGSMGSTKRLKAALPSIKYALEQGAKLILASHVQRPKGQIAEKWRTEPIAEELETLLGGVKVNYVDDCVGPKVKQAVSAMNNGDILLLENLRFHAGEEANDPAFVEELAKFVDVYILDGFATAHRAHASTVGLPLYLIEQGREVAAGKLMEQEVEYWQPLATGQPGGVIVIGGAKLKEKMMAVAAFPEKFDKVVVTGVVANVFLRAAGYDIGNSLYKEGDKDYTDQAKKVLDSYGKKIILPKTVVLDDKSKVSVSSIPAERSIADDVLEQGTLRQIISAPRVAIFGAMGRFEDGYTEGTDQLTAVLAAYRGFLRIGGGDAEKALREKLKVPMSTGGGASIEYIIYGKLPGLEALSGKFFNPKQA